MTEQEPYGGDISAGDEGYGDPVGGQTAGDDTAAKVNVPTVLVAVGLSALISAIILAIGVVGLVLSDRFDDDGSAASTPTVVNLGAAGVSTGGSVQYVAPTAGTTTEPAAGAPATDTTTGGEVPQAQAPQAGGQQSQQGSGQTGGGQQSGTQQQQSTPTPLTADQLTTKVKLIMNTGASNASRADELQGGTRALGTANQVANMLRVSGAGFSYKVIGPVTQNGKTLNATLQMSLAGSGSRTMPLSWVWMDNKWKLSNTSVCAIGKYAMLGCSV